MYIDKLKILGIYYAFVNHNMESCQYKFTTSEGKNEFCDRPVFDEGYCEHHFPIKLRNQTNTMMAMAITQITRENIGKLDDFMKKNFAVERTD